MTLRDFIYKHGGPDRAGQKLGVKAHAIRIWLRGTGTPRPRTMQLIFKLSKGKVSYDTIIEESLRNKGGAK